MYFFKADQKTIR